MTEGIRLFDSTQTAPERSVYEDFSVLFVRVYHLLDGRIVIPQTVYALYEQAFEELQLYYPEVGVRSLDDVSYVTIERRFYPVRANQYLGK